MVGYIVATVVLLVVIALATIATFLQFKKNKQLRFLLKKENPQTDKKEGIIVKKGIENEKENNKVQTTDDETSITSLQKITPTVNEKSGQVIGDISSIDFVRIVKKVMPFLTNYRDHPEQYDVMTDVLPGFLYNSLPDNVPEQPCSFDDILRDIQNIILPGMNHWQHPQFYSWLVTGRSYSDLLAELLISTLSASQGKWCDSPSLAELEVVMVNWVGRALGLPEKFLFHGNSEKSSGGGVFTESASEAILLAVMAARTRMINKVLRAEGVVSENQCFLYSNKISTRIEKPHQIASKLVVFTNMEAHSCVEKACNMSTVRCVGIKTSRESDFAITGEIFEMVVNRAKAEGLIPCMVVVTEGTTSSCAFDHLEDIANIAAKYDMWVHVDAAYGGSEWIDPLARSTQKGLHLANSIEINLHKLLRHSQSTSLLWTTDQAALRAPLYDANTSSDHAHNVRNWGVHEKRREKALKVWFTFRMFGTEELKNYVNRCKEMSEYFRTLMLAHPNIRMFGERKLGLFCFQYVEPGMSEAEINQHSDKLVTYINESKKLLVSHSVVGKSDIIRISVSYEKMCKADIEKSWTLMKKFIEEYKTSRNNPCLVKFPPICKPKEEKSEDALCPLPKQQKISSLALEKCSSPTGSTNSAPLSTKSPIPKEQSKM